MRTTPHEYADVYVGTPADVPPVEHWAIIKGSSVHVPGDLRSQQAPGHGYPAHDKNIISYEAYLTYDKFERAVVHATEGRDAFRAIHVTVEAFKTKVVVEQEQGYGHGV